MEQTVKVGQLNQIIEGGTTVIPEYEMSIVKSWEEIPAGGSITATSSNVIYWVFSGACRRNF